VVAINGLEDHLSEGQRAASELDAALRAAGFLFPSIRGDFPTHGGGMVKLGGMSAREASRLATWLREQVAGRETPLHMSLAFDGGTHAGHPT
jgi:hypothetical protein